MMRKINCRSRENPRYFQTVFLWIEKFQTKENWLKDRCKIEETLPRFRFGSMKKSFLHRITTGTEKRINVISKAVSHKISWHSFDEAATSSMARPACCGKKTILAHSMPSEALCILHISWNFQFFIDQQNHTPNIYTNLCMCYVCLIKCPFLLTFFASLKLAKDVFNIHDTHTTICV